MRNRFHERLKKRPDAPRNTYPEGPLPSKHNVGPGSKMWTLGMNLFRGYFRGPSADYSPHFGEMLRWKPDSLSE